MVHQVGQLCCCGSSVEQIEPKKVGRCTVSKGTLSEAKLSHHPDGMILNTPKEPWQHNQLCVTGTEEYNEGLNSGWDDALSYCILSQLCQLLVFLANALDSLAMASTVVGLEGRLLWAQDIHSQMSGQPNLH